MRPGDEVVIEVEQVGRLINYVISEQEYSGAGGYLKRFSDGVTAHFINGEDCPGEAGETFDNLTPTDNTSLGLVAAGSAEDIDRACRAAQEAFPAWSGAPGKERRKILSRFAELVEQHAEEIALVESMDCGQPIRFMRAAAARGAENFRFFADKAPEAGNGLSLHQDQHLNYTNRTAIGRSA